MRTFEGVRVIDFTQAIAGPFATYQLALMGADVPDSSRWRPGQTTHGQGLRANGYSAIYLSANSGKRSITPI